MGFKHLERQRGLPCSQDLLDPVSLVLKCMECAALSGAWGNVKAEAWRPPAPLVNHGLSHKGSHFRSSKSPMFRLPHYSIPADSMRVIMVLDHAFASAPPPPSAKTAPDRRLTNSLLLSAGREIFSTREALLGSSSYSNMRTSTGRRGAVPRSHLKPGVPSGGVRPACVACMRQAHRWPQRCR